MSVTDGDPPYTQPTRGFGAIESADETRQAQQTISNDAPTDVNCNAALARAQASSFALLQANFEANANRLNKLFDHVGAKLALLP